MPQALPLKLRSPATTALHVLRNLVDALMRTHWVAEQRMSEFQHELDEAVELLREETTA